MFAVVVNTQEYYQSPGCVDQIIALGWGKTERDAAYQAHYSTCRHPKDVDKKFEELEVSSDSEVIKGFKVFTLSDISAEWFDLVINNGMSVSLIIKGGVAHKESLDNRGELMTEKELEELKALYLN